MIRKVASPGRHWRHQLPVELSCIFRQDPHPGRQLPTLASVQSRQQQLHIGPILNPTGEELAQDHIAELKYPEFVLHAVKRYGAKPVSFVTGISKSKLRRGELSEDELKRLHAAIAEIDRRVIQNANTIAETLGYDTVVRDPWATVCVLHLLHFGTVRI